MSFGLEYLRNVTHKARLYAFICTMASFGDLSQQAVIFPAYVKTLGIGARTHPDQRMRWVCKFFLAAAGMMQPSLTNDDWDWDEYFLDADGTNLLQQTTEFCENRHTFFCLTDAIETQFVSHRLI